MELFTTINVPLGLDDDLSEYLVTLDNRIADSFLRVQTFSPVRKLPARPSPGDLRYFQEPVMPTINQEGLWFYKTTGWVRVI